MSSVHARPAMQRGAVLIAAILIAAIASAVVAQLIWQQQLWWRQHEYKTEHTQARSLALAGVNWAKLILQNDARTSQIDHLREEWAIPLPPIPIENGDISGFIVDQNALFNLNNLVQNGVPVAIEQTRFRRLLTHAGLPVELSEALTDWLDRDGVVISPASAEDEYYRTHASGRLAANQPLMHIGELRGVKGFTPEVIAALAPWVTALPQRSSVNVNTASREVLLSLIDGLQPERASALIGRHRAFSTLDDFRTALTTDPYNIDSAALGVSSQFFVVTVTARQGRTQVRVQSLLKRESSNWPRVVWQMVE